MVLYLLSYDTKGEYVDCIQIGEIGNYSGDREEATIQGNEILSKSYWCEGEEEETKIRKTLITHDLHFHKYENFQLP